MTYMPVYNSPFVFANFNVSDPAGSETLLYGDVDDDGEINILDVVLANRVYVGIDKLNDKQKKQGDVDGDLKITLSDSMQILRYLVHLIDKF